MRLGVKTGLRDAPQMAELARRHGARVLEWQMLPGDLEGRRDEALETLSAHAGGFELRVHQPERIELGGASAWLDPASRDEGLRRASVRALSDSLALAERLGATGFILHGGGVHAPDAPGGSPEALRRSLQELPRGVPLFLENMPIHYGDRWRSPAYMRDSEGLLAFADLADGYTLDVSHAYLARPGGSRAHVLALARALGPHVRHLHATGSRAARGHEGEGTPFSDSDYGVDLVVQVLGHLHRDVVVVPETMNGHLDGGRLFDEDLDALRPLVLSRA